MDAEVFKAGAELAIEITAERSIGARPTRKTIDWSGTVYWQHDEEVIKKNDRIHESIVLSIAS